MTKEIPFDEDEDFGHGSHVKGSTQCGAGWCDGWGFPKKCECGGLIHAEFEEETDDSVILKRKCDTCNEVNGDF